MLLTLAALVVGTRSVDFLLVRIGVAKVIRVLAPPFADPTSVSACADSPSDRRSFAAPSAEDGDKTNDDKKNISASRIVLLLQATSEGEANRASKKREKAKGKGY
jgi:hypothetical protein